MKYLHTKLTNGYIEFETGSKGPSYDPYYVKEITVQKDSMNIILHMGLVTWLRINENTISKSEQASLKTFKEITGYTPEEWEKFCYKAKSVCKRCKSKEFYEQEGYPGETFTICCHCNEVADFSFNINAVI